MSSDTPKSDAIYDVLMAVLAQYDKKQIYFSDLANAVYDAKASSRIIERDLTRAHEDKRALRDALNFVKQDTAIHAGTGRSFEIVCAALSATASPEPANKPQGAATEGGL